MSRTPHYDAKLDALFRGLIIDETELALLRRFRVPLCPIQPLERLRRLIAFNSGIALWWKPHAESGEPILSYVHPDNPIKVIRDKEWFARDNTQYGRDADVSRPFFEQLRALYGDVPFNSLGDPGNSTNTIGVSPFECTDSFMVFVSMRAAKSAYIRTSIEVSDSVDVVDSFGGISESYSISHCRQLHNCQFVFESRRSANSAFLFDCRDCEFCFGASNQRHKQYLWFNERLSKDEWERRRAAIDLSCSSTLSAYQQQFSDFMREAVWPERFNSGCEDSNGEYLEKCVRCQDGYHLQKSTDCFHVWYGTDAQNSAYVTGIGFASDIWCSAGIAFSQNVKFSLATTRCQSLEYCHSCISCTSCFGCVGLYNKKFCIFNKPYSEDEYWRRVDEIKCAMLERGEYGELMPTDLNKVGAQFSEGNLLLGYTDEEIRFWGGKIYDPARGLAFAPELGGRGEPLSASSLPDCIVDVSDDLLGRPILDEALGRPYTVTKHELDFYRRRSVPIPREHFLTRLSNLTHLMNSPAIETAVCASCGASITVHRNLSFSNRRILCLTCYDRFLESR